MNDHQGRVLLVTAVPGSGKTTIMKNVAAALSGKRIRGFVTGEIRETGRRVGFELSMFTGDKRLLAGIGLAGAYGFYTFCAFLSILFVLKMVQSIANSNALSAPATTRHNI
jgi:hypothetical protein